MRVKPVWMCSTVASRASSWLPARMVATIRVWPLAVSARHWALATLRDSMNQ